MWIPYENPINFSLAENSTDYDTKIKENIDEAKSAALNQQRAHNSDKSLDSILKNLGIFLRAFLVLPSVGIESVFLPISKDLKVIKDVFKSGSKSLEDGDLVNALIHIFGELSNDAITVYQAAAAKGERSALKGERTHKI